MGAAHGGAPQSLIYYEAIFSKYLAKGALQTANSTMRILALRFPFAAVALSDSFHQCGLCEVAHCRISQRM